MNLRAYRLFGRGAPVEIMAMAFVPAFLEVPEGVTTFVPPLARAQKLTVEVPARALRRSGAVVQRRGKNMSRSASIGPESAEPGPNSAKFWPPER